MPRISWNDINDILHDIKNDLIGLTKIELQCKKVRERASIEIEKIEDIILKQTNGDDDNETAIS